MQGKEGIETTQIRGTTLSKWFHTIVTALKVALRTKTPQEKVTKADTVKST